MGGGVGDRKMGDKWLGRMILKDCLVYISQWYEEERGLHCASSRDADETFMAETETRPETFSLETETLENSSETRPRPPVAETRPR